jgi:hypothetical protein
MSDLLQDVWHDLREKRLWPVALVLAIAIVAVPVLLTKSAAQPPAPIPVATTPTSDSGVDVSLDGDDAASSESGSTLDHFAEGDPFTPPARIVDRADDAAAAGTAGPGDGSPPSDGGGSGGGSPPSSPAPPIDVAPPTTRTETAEYEYVADATFWTGDRRREIRGLRKLDMLPDEAAPVLIFMGTSEQGGNAVFLVDSTLKAAGEGRCVPSPANCAYVHLGPGSEHAFTTAEGDSYRLRIDEIRRVEVKAAARASAQSSARAAVGARPATRRFELPSLVDLVAVTETRTTPAGTPSPDDRSSLATGGR